MPCYVVYFFGVPSHCWEIVRAENIFAAEATIASRYGLAVNIHARVATDRDRERWSLQGVGQ